MEPTGRHRTSRRRGVQPTTALRRQHTPYARVHGRGGGGFSPLRYSRVRQREKPSFLPSTVAEDVGFLSLLSSLRRRWDGGEVPRLSGRRVDRGRLVVAGGVRSVSKPPSRIKFSGPPPRGRRGVTPRSRGSSLPGRDRRDGGGDLVGDFCSSSSTASRRRLLQCRREGRGKVGGASAASQTRLAVVWLIPSSVQGLRSAAGGSGGVPRRSRRGGPDLEVDDELGDGPRPTSHSDKVSTCAPLLRFIKPNGDGAASISGELAAVSSSFGARCGGAGVMQRHGFGAEFPGTSL
jgi:hypothetical protein